MFFELAKPQVHFRKKYQKPIVRLRYDVGVKTDYLPAVQSAIEYIESHLSEDLLSQMIASQIGFSQYHFHRIFTALVGESVKDYLRKRRLSVAADELRRSNTAILTIALRCGFDSQEAFTRAFGKVFGTTPGAYRRQGSSGLGTGNFSATNLWVHHLNRGIDMKPEIVRRSADLAVGMGDSFVRGATEAISELWKRFLPRMHEISNQKEYQLGLCMAQHASIQKKEGNSFIYVAAVAVDSAETVPKGMVLCQTAEATYAKFTHVGPIAEIKHTVEYIWGTWIPKCGYELLDSPDFELYDKRFDPATASGEVDIYVPVKT